MEMYGHSSLVSRFGLADHPAASHAEHSMCSRTLRLFKDVAKAHSMTRQLVNHL